MLNKSYQVTNKDFLFIYRNCRRSRSSAANVAPPIPGSNSLDKEMKRNNRSVLVEVETARSEFPCVRRTTSCHGKVLISEWKESGMEEEEDGYCDCRPVPYQDSNISCDEEQRSQDVEVSEGSVAVEIPAPKYGIFIECPTENTTVSSIDFDRISTLGGDSDIDDDDYI